MKELYLYLATVPVFFAIDMLWLGVIAPKFYQDQIGHFLRPTPNWTAAVIFYLLYVVGILIFAVLPNMDAGAGQVLLYGALFGFFAYATYDMTNFAVMKDWPLTVTIVDMIWGTVLTGSVAVASYFISRWIY